MKMFSKEISVESTTQIELIDITDFVREAIRESGVVNGFVHVFAPHTTMSIRINHNEDMLKQDFMRMLYRLVPVDDQYSHDLFELRRDAKADGRSNGHSHCKALLLGSSESIPVKDGHMSLSDIQSIFAIEFDGARKRDLTIHILGE